MGSNGNGGGGGAASSGVGVTTKDLPISLFDAVVREVDGAATTTFQPAEYHIETIEAERISVDHVARNSAVAGGQAGQHVAHLGGVGSAVKMLSSRVEVLLHYLQDVQAGRAPPDHAVLRAAASLAGRLHPSLFARSD